MIFYNTDLQTMPCLGSLVLEDNPRSKHIYIKHMFQDDISMSII